MIVFWLWERKPIRIYGKLSRQTFERFGGTLLRIAVNFSMGEGPVGIFAHFEPYEKGRTVKDQAGMQEFGHCD